MSSPSETPPPADDVELLQSGFRFALSLSHHLADAEDLVQEAWVRLYRAYGRVESRSVLFTAIRNLHIDQCRRRKIVYMDALEDEAVEPAADLSEEAGVRGDLEALLATLHPAEREVLFLHYHQGYTAEEVGQIVGRPRNTILSIAHRAVAKLRSRADSSPAGRVCNQILSFFVVVL